MTEKKVMATIQNSTGLLLSHSLFLLLRISLSLLCHYNLSRLGIFMVFFANPLVKTSVREPNGNPSSRIVSPADLELPIPFIKSSFLAC
jgi:hypothetical protein